MSTPSGPSRRQTAAIVAEVLAEHPVFDGHNDLITVLRERTGYDASAFSSGQPWAHTDLPRLRAGKIGAQFWSAWVPPTLSGPEAVAATIEQIDAIRRLVAAHPRELVFASTAAQVRQAFRDGRIASLIGVEGGHALNRSLAVLRSYARLGVRYLTLTHTRNVPWADSATDEPVLDGLSDEGRAIVAELNRIGVLVDLSHVSAATQRDAIAASQAPVLFSHSSAFAVNPHPRNVDDDVLELVARNGGLVQVTFVPDFISSELAAWTRAYFDECRRAGEQVSFGGPWLEPPRAAETVQQWRERVGADPAERPGPFDHLPQWQADNPRPAVGIDVVVAHIEHIRDVAGIAHVSLGGDYDGTPTGPDGLEDVGGYPRLFEALAERGWSRSDLAALASDNALRVLQDGEDAATEPLYLQGAVDD